MVLEQIFSNKFYAIWFNEVMFIILNQLKMQSRLQIVLASTIKTVKHTNKNVIKSGYYAYLM